MLIKITNVLVIFTMYFVIEVYHDYHVSKDSKGSENNIKWHQWDVWFHLLFAILMWINAGWQFGIFIVLSRAVLFDRHFSWVWKRDLFYVGKNEPALKKKLIIIWSIISTILWIFNLIIILL